MATIQAGAVLVAACALSFAGRQLQAVMLALVYGGLCDVLWRATNARVPWEASKYLVLITSVAAVVRFTRRPRGMFAPVALAACLVPAALLTAVELPFAAARDDVTFTLLGPLALASCTALCRQIIMSRSEFRQLLWWALSPCISVGAIAAWNTAQAGEISFGNESMFVTAGGFGPNQVSAMLGVGALFAIAIAIAGASGRNLVLVSITGLLLVAQALITLSRGGIYALVLGATAMFATTLFLSSGNRSRGFLVLVGGGLFAVLAFTWAQGFSGGAVENRFSQDDSGRGRIVSTEIALFWEHPWLGIGAGQAKSERVIFDAAEADHASHNEFSRLLAEHGMFGLAIMGLLILIAAQAFLRGVSPTNRAITVGFCVWSVAAMFHSATRLAAVSLVFGLASLRIETESDVAGQPAGIAR